MDLRLLRYYVDADGTRGDLYVDGRPECNTLEDEEAIPAGRYRVVIDRSLRFGRLLPRLLNVPGATGIVFHSGQTQVETAGSILVGHTDDGGTFLPHTLGEPWVPIGDGQLSRSREALDDLQAQIAGAQAHGWDVWLTITSQGDQL
jgi:hypothetical protein